MFEEFEEIIECAEIGDQKTLDLEIDSEFHNYYANGICVSNSHCVSYSYIAAQTLFLKHYYPTEFYASLLNHPKSNASKEKEQEWLANSIAAAMARGIKITRPSRKSGWNWTMTGKKEIAMGFSGINGLGEKAYLELVGFLNLENLTLETISMNKFFELPFSVFNKTAFSSCLKAGVFDDWSTSREHLLGLKLLKRKKRDPRQLALFDLNSEEFNTDLKNHEYLPTSEEEKQRDFIEVCNFNLKRIEELGKIKKELEEKAERPIESILNFSKNDYYFFFVDGISFATSAKGGEYIVIKVGDGISHTTLRVFPARKKTKDDLYDLVRDNVEIGGVYISEFVKNQKGFINFKRNAQFKRIR